MKGKVYSLSELKEIHQRPLLSLVFDAAEVHRKYHNPNEVQVSNLVSIKTGGCPEDCAYCPQAARYHTDIKVHRILEIDEVKERALKAKDKGVSRMCLGAAWREVRDNRDFDKVLNMVRTVSDLDMEVCCTLGMLTEDQAKRLEEAGLYAYNHNLDSSEEFYGEVISTREYSDRIDTIANVRKTNITVCSGGIIGMGESVDDRLKMLYTLHQLDPYPESVPINTLVPIEGTPLEDQPIVNFDELVRMIATARICMPKTMVRLSAGRERLSVAEQAMCFMAGANSIFSGEVLLTAPNPDFDKDQELFKTLDLKPMSAFQKEKLKDVDLV